MNKILAKIYTSVLPNKKKRDAIYNILTKPTDYSNNTALRNIENKVSQIYKYLILKDIAPDLIEHFKVDLFNIDKEVYDAYSTNLIYQPEIQAIRNQFSIEGEFLTACLSLVENNVPYTTRCNIFKELIKLNTPHKAMIYQQAVINSCRHRDFETLKTLFIQMNHESDAERIILPRTRLFEISFWLLMNEEDKAKEVLHLYLKKWKLKDIETILPVANLAYKYGYSNTIIEKSSFVFEKFKESEINEEFKNFVKNKKVAIVGNGPQELGTNNGEKIDNYDVVIRFNDATKYKNNIEDYGSKTNILSRYQGSVFPTESYELLAHAEDIYFVGFWLKTIEDLYKYTKDGNKICYFPHKDLFKQNVDLNTPTTGVQYLWWIKNINPNFSIDDCYGFSFKEKGDFDKKPRDFFNPTKVNLKDPHDMHREKVAIWDLFSKDNLNE